MFSFWLLKVLVLELKENGTKAFHSFMLSRMQHKIHYRTLI